MANFSVRRCGVQGIASIVFNQIFKEFNQCPADNELASCEIIQLKEYKKYFVKDDVATGWFYNFCEYLLAKLSNPAVEENNI